MYTSVIHFYFLFQTEKQNRNIIFSVGSTFDENKFDPTASAFEKCGTYPSLQKAEVLYAHCSEVTIGRYVVVNLVGMDTLYVCEIEIYQSTG